MEEPKVELIDEKVVITLEPRHAELLAMLLGTFSVNSFEKTINDFYSKEGYAVPFLCGPHIPTSEPNWRLSEPMTGGHIFNGISDVLDFEGRYYNTNKWDCGLRLEH